MLDTALRSAANNDFDWVIDEHGFAAILQNEDLELGLTGIIGNPRVNPTGSGLWIEDSFPAAMSQITVASLENFERLENPGDRFTVLGETDEHSAAGGDVTRSARSPTRRAARASARRPTRVLCSIA